MPASVTLGILESNQRAAQTLYENIDRQINGVLDLQLKGSEFQYKIAQDAVNAAEQKRFNDARILSLKNENDLRAFQLETERQLAPLKLETAKVGLANERVQRSASLFNNIVSPYDTVIGSVFAKTQNPDLIRQYTGYKQQWQAAVASGNPFGSQEAQVYQKNVDALVKNYSDPTKDMSQADYNPETANLLKSFAPQEAQRYELRNPVNKPIRQSLVEGMLNGGPEFRAKYGTTANFNQQESADIINAGNAIDAIDQQIKLEFDKQKNFTDPSYRDTPERKQYYDKLINESNEKVNELTDRKRMINESILGGNRFLAPSEKVDKAEQDRLAKEEAARKANQEMIKSLGINQNPESLIREQIKSPQARIEQDKTKMIDSNFKELSERAPRIMGSFSADSSWMQQVIVQNKGKLDDAAKSAITTSMMNAVEKTPFSEILSGKNQMSLAEMQLMIDQIPYEGNDMKLIDVVPNVKQITPYGPVQGVQTVIPLYSTDDKDEKESGGSKSKSIENRDFYKSASLYIYDNSLPGTVESRYKKLLAHVLSAKLASGSY